VVAGSATVENLTPPVNNSASRRHSSAVNRFRKSAAICSNFSSVVQTLVQTFESSVVSSLLLSLTIGDLLVDIVEVTGSNPVSPTTCKSRRTKYLSYLPVVGSAARFYESKR